MHIPVRKRSNGCLAGGNFGWVALLLFSLPAISLAQQIAIAEYAVPARYGPQVIAAGPDGELWFTVNSNRNIWRLTTAGVFTRYPAPENAGPFGITAGPDGALWFTESTSDNIGRIATTGVITQYPVPTDGAAWGLTAGPDGALWFTQTIGNIGRITTAGVITEYSVPTANSNPRWITAGPDGAVWFTEANGNNVGRITTAGVITEYPVPTANSNPAGIAAGQDGALWFTESNGNNIGRITTTGVITEYPVPTANSSPVGITAGPDGALWFTENGVSAIARITTTGVITEYPAPTANSAPWGITAGSDGALWFTEMAGGRIGEVVFVTAGLSVNPLSGSYRTNLTLSGSAFAPNEPVDVYVSGVGSAVLASATADSNGSFTAAVREPQSPYGPHIFLGVGQSSGRLGAASFFTTARLIMNPNSGAVGSTTAVQGYGFGPSETVKIWWKNPRFFLGNATADVNGTFANSTAFTFTIPTWAPPGLNMVVGVGATTVALGGGPFTVQ